MKVFIAGGTGNMGQNLTRKLLDKGHEVVLLTRTPDRIAGLIGRENVTFVKGSILDFDALRAGLKGCDAVVDFALNMDGRTPLDILDNETRGVVGLLQLAEEAGAKKFIYTSTVAVMGPGVTEDDPIRPWGLYGATKAAAEAYVKGFHEYFAGFNGERDKPVTMLRNIVRPGETFSDPAFEGGASESWPLIRNIVRKVYKGENLEFNINEGCQWAAGKQVADVYMAILESDVNQEIFLAVGSAFVRHAEIAEMAKELLPKSPSIITVTGEEDPWPLRSTKKIKDYFGIEYTGKEYLKDHIAWLIDQCRKEEAGEPTQDYNHSTK
ncbi:MAG: NAD(P)-dependent oxidoreductase [Lachnospiraceae bacterium]|nr:NAD(P)-dependent oxidoreductase [Lachnospiraceae bacterium]